MKLNKCFFCNKLKFTPYHITEIASEIQTYDMCKECGWEFVKEAYEDTPKLKDTSKPKKANLVEINTPQDLLNFITSLGLTTPMTPQTKSKPDCQCGMSAAEFEQYGKFGCAYCYDHFSEYMEKLVFPYHGANEHVGKRPKPKAAENLSPEEHLKLLKLRLAKAIEMEHYEQAGEIHAQIKQLADHLVDS